MNKIDKISALSMVCLLLISCLSFTACDNDEISTDQYTKGVKLNVFGPCPVARGGELRFLGSGMNKVTGVVIPGSDEITEIRVMSDTEIRITVPQSAEVGLIVLNAPTGNITTKTKITFTEPISLDKIDPLLVKAGDELTITGEYLNLIKEVIFVENVVATEFVSHSRKEIKLIVPAAAQSGKIILSDGAEMPNWIYSDTELSITLPSVERTIDLTKAKPGDLITVTGKNLDLVTKVEMPNGDNVKFEVVKEKLTFTLPANASNGAVVMIPASGVKVAIANIGMAIPTDLVAMPAEGIRAQDVITIKGLNMELVSTITFPGVKEAVQLTAQTSTEIKVTMPNAAISGNLVLNTASGNTVSVAISTLKPEVLAYGSSTVPAGENAVLKGKNLDLVTSVTFGGDKKVAVTPSSATELSVAVPVDAKTGELTLTMANGEKVKVPSLTVSKPEFCYIPTLPSDDAAINAGQVLMVTIENGTKLQSIQVNGKEVQYILSGTALYISIPSSAAGKTAITLKSSNGDITYTISVIGSGIRETVVFEGALMLTWGDGGRVMITANAFDDVAAGSILKIQFQQTANWGQAQISNGSWGGLSFAEFGGGTTMNTDNLGNKGLTEKELILTNEILTNIKNNKKEGYSLIMQGSDFVISKVSIITKAATEVVLMDERFDLGVWAGSFRIYRETFADVTPKVGSILKFYVEITGNPAKLQINDANWSEWKMIEETTNVSTIEATVDQLLLNALLNTQDGWSSTALVIQGQHIIVKKVTLVP